MADNPPPLPQINDGYWFGYSKTLADSALKSRDDAADKLQTFVGWLWTVYTAGTVIGLNLGKLSVELWPGGVLIASPVLVLMAVYWLAIWVRTPALLQFDPRSPDEIRQVYDHNVARKQVRLRVTLAAAAVASVTIAGALIYASTVPPPSAAVDLKAVLQRDSSGTSLFIDATVAAADQGTLSVYEYAEGKRGRLLASKEVTAIAGQGVFRVTLRLDDPVPKSLLVTIDADTKPRALKILVSRVLTA